MAHPTTLNRWLSVRNALNGGERGTATIRNAAGGAALPLARRHALAQHALTGCQRDTCYVEGADLEREMLELCKGVGSEFIARLAVYAHRHGYMKDSPALLCAVLASRRDALLEPVFPQVINTGRMLRTFVRIIRDGVAGRRSFGTRPRRLIRQWLAARSDAALVRDSVGNSPSLADILRLVRPRPADARREALHAWILGRRVDPAALPDSLRALAAFRADPSQPLPDLPMELLPTETMRAEHWVLAAERISWHALRMSLVRLQRAGAFDRPGAIEAVSARIEDREAILRAGVQPHVLLAARAQAETLPARIRRALHRALEHALGNVPRLAGSVVVCPDVSGSMSSPVTGVLGGTASAVRCVDAAGLVTAGLLRANPGTLVLPFADTASPLRIGASLRLAGITAKIASLAGGGTRCAAPVRWLNQHDRRPSVVVLVSDNESWVGGSRAGQTELMDEWNQLRRRVPDARLVCWDLQPGSTTQAEERTDILNVGGFSGAVFDVISRFVRGESGGGLLAAIEAVPLEG